MFNDRVDEFFPLKYWKYYNPEVIIFNNYLINIAGKIWSLKSNKFLSSQKHYNGYVRIDLVCDNNKRHTILLHRAVACTFLHNPDKSIYTQVDHLDQDKKHHHLRNLEWVTASENNLRKFRDFDSNQLYLFEDEKR